MMERVLPVNVYRGARKLMVAAMVPGLEPQDIRVSVEGDRLSIEGGPRGHWDRKPWHLREWTVGPYRRAVDLPYPVDASQANATFANGVLVLIFPVALHPVSGTVPLVKVGTAKGQCIRHVGRDPRPRPGPTNRRPSRKS